MVVPHGVVYLYKGGVNLYCGRCGNDVFVWVTLLGLEGKVQDVKDGKNNFVCRVIVEF